jgi:hypothetical protein
MKCVRKNDISENAFKSLNTSNKAYLFGFLLADGYVNDKGTIRVGVNSKDESILHKFKQCIGGRVYKRKRLDRRNGINYICSEFQCDSVKIVNDIKKIGFRSNHVRVPIKYRKHLVLGFLDGDGCIYKNNKNYLFQVTFSGQKNTNWNFILDIIPDKYRRKFHISKNSDRLRICGDNAKKFLDWVYSEECMGLSRKRVVYEEYKK